ncbi:MAG: hypothetical protein E7310_07940 [Clostridiales bacterium]|nr:hypothetical protein [Clostridiales bacterium]
MKKFMVILIAMTLILTIAASCNGSKTNSGTITEKTNITTVETTEPETKPVAIKDVMVSDEVPEYSAAEENWPDIYQVVELDAPLNGYYGDVKFFYVPYADREGENYPSYLKIEVMEKSEDFAITFTDREQEEGKVYPANISEGFVYPNSQLNSSSNFNAYKQGTSLTLNGFQPGLKTIDMVFRNAMPAMEIYIGEETYDVYCLQFIF